MNHHSSVPILSSVTTTSRGDKHKPFKTPKRSFQAYGATSAGAGSVTVEIYGSNLEDPDTSTESDWVLVGTITLVLSTTRVSDGFTTDAPWKFVKARVSAIAGTNAAVSCYMGG
jgi:hypothetical protein